MTRPAAGLTQWNQEKLLGMARSFMESRILLTAAELDLFSLTAVKPLSAGQIAQRVGADPRAMTIFLDALTAMGLLLKEKGLYRTETSAAPLLFADSPVSVLPMLHHANDLWDRWNQLTSKIAGKQDRGKSMRVFIGAMHVVGSTLAPRVVSHIGVSGVRRLLDVGGGSGTYTASFLEMEPRMRATLFDLPPVIEMARERLEAAGLLERVKLVAGDYRKDALPAGHDLAFVSAIIHQNSPEENATLFRKIYDALEPGGRIVVRDHLLSPDRTQPRSGALFAVNMLMGTTGGNSYTEDEVREALKEAGFVLIKTLQRDARMDGLMEGFRRK